MTKPSGADSLNSPELSADDRIDILCDQFEQKWQSGPAPRLESFLRELPGVEPSQLFKELFLLELAFRRKAGDPANLNDYLARFPQFGSIILEHAPSHDSDGLADTAASPVSNQHVVEVGQRIRQFILLERLGQGGFGAVWKAHDASLRRIVAVKMPLAGELTDDELRRFIREGQAAAQLSHPNIVPVYEVGRLEDSAYIVSEFIDGVTLHAWSVAGRDLPEIIQMCAKIADAVEHAHQRGIVHRDLKPANILVDGAGEPYVTDFGLAKWADEASGLTLEGQMLGTPAYMAPEQARGDSPRVDCRADVYALGVVLYELMTGERPFSGDYAELLRAIVDDEPAPPRRLVPKISRDAETICLKAMEKDPRRRYASAQALAADLRRSARDEPIVARRISSIERSLRWVRRRPWIAAALLAIVVAAISLGAAGWWRQRYDAALGLQTIRITSDPPGAKLAFVPLDKRTGQPQRDLVHFASGTAPIRERLKPGDYLVIAVYQDGRFHEVYRRVPQQLDEPGSHNHQFFERDAAGEVVLASVTVPDNRRIAEIEMALVEGSNAFEMGLPNSHELPQHIRAVASFYVKTTEFTLGDFRRLLNAEPSFLASADALAETHALRVSFDVAASVAEDLGLRLPTEVEYEYMATNRGRSKFPSGDSFPPLTLAEFGPVATPVFDRLENTPPVFGLVSNVAEWTSSWWVPYPPAKRRVLIEDHRVVRGGNLATVEGDPAVTEESRGPRQRCSVVRHGAWPGLGFRCVRSAEPMFTYDQIP
ncbi:bifunctional serine/threonine-protein kinase/formylglycine-generating enzyme family protein [Pirellulales bacterium]|nr:bifunctional serine/threonine-protein kinase/formylglycine-generating enzyme family protein [Pirellulales bacterium]